MNISPLEFSFTAEPGLTDSEIQSLWEATLAAQDALDKFLTGEFSEHELTDILTACEIDIEETREALESNANYLGLVPI